MRPTPRPKPPSNGCSRRVRTSSYALAMWRCATMSLAHWMPWQRCDWPGSSTVRACSMTARSCRWTGTASRRCSRPKCKARGTFIRPAATPISCCFPPAPPSQDRLDKATMRQRMRSRMPLPGCARHRGCRPCRSIGGRGPTSALQPIAGSAPRPGSCAPYRRGMAWPHSPRVSAQPTGEVLFESTQLAVFDADWQALSPGRGGLVASAALLARWGDARRAGLKTGPAAPRAATERLAQPHSRGAGKPSPGVLREEVRVLAAKVLGALAAQCRSG